MNGVGYLEAIGLHPFRRGLAECLAALAGRNTPKSKANLRSLQLLHPSVALPLWRGKDPCPGKVLVTVLPNRTPPPFGSQHSVGRTQVRDFRGRDLTYDSHRGTDFAVPPGTPILAPAAGEVVRVERMMRRGGNKVLIDHGGGLHTGHNHLSRVSVTPGQTVSRGERIGLSGMTGLDGVLFSPWLAPHLHFDVILDGAPVDPWAATGETSMWLGGGLPKPALPSDPQQMLPSVWRPTAIAGSLALLNDPADRHAMGQWTLQAQAAGLTFDTMYRPERLRSTPQLVDKPTPRRPWLSLPFDGQLYTGVVFFDAL